MMRDERFHCCFVRTASALAVVLALAGCTRAANSIRPKWSACDIVRHQEEASRASASRCSRKACLARSRACRPIWSRAISRRRRQRRRRTAAPEATAKAAAGRRETEAKTETQAEGRASAPRGSQRGTDPAWDQNAAAPPGRGQRPAQSGLAVNRSPPQQTVWPAPPSGGPAQQAAPPAQSIWPDPPPTRNTHSFALHVALDWIHSRRVRG